MNIFINPLIRTLTMNTPTTKLKRENLANFLSQLRDKNWITRVNVHLTPLVIQHLKGTTFRPKRQQTGANAGKSEVNWTSEDFKNIGFKASSMVSVGPAKLDAFIYALGRFTPILAPTEEYYELYQASFNEKPSATPLLESGQKLYRAHNAPDPSEKPVLLGDYIHFRSESRPDSSERDRKMRISRTLVRVYIPDHSAGLRYMYLPFSFKNEYLAGRGWVEDLKNNYLFTANIVDRSGAIFDEEKYHGGLTAMVVQVPSRNPDNSLKDPSDNRFMRYRELENGQLLVDSACTLTFRALSGKAPSVSRGYLLRVRGLEDFGGKPDNVAGDQQDTSKYDTADIRYQKIKDLQDALNKVYHQDVTIEDAASVLAEQTGFDKDVFYTPSDAFANRGLLVNTPFLAHDESSDLTNLRYSDVGGPLALPNKNVPGWGSDAFQTNEKRSFLDRFGPDYNFENKIGEKIAQLGKQ